MMAQSTDFAVSGELLRDLRVWRSRAAIVGVAALAVTAIGAIAWPAQFFRSYLWSYVFYLGVTLGSMAWLMLQYLSGGAWGMVIRRPCEAATRTLPLLAILFVPVGLGISSLYRWSHADVVAADAIIRHKHAYLNVPFFLARAALYFAGWLVCSWYLNRWSSREDREGPAVVHRKLATWAGPGLIFWAFSITFMAVDWVLSLDPHWFSTIFGMLFMAGQGLSSMAFLITLMVLLSYRRPMSDVLTPRHLQFVGQILGLFIVRRYRPEIKRPFKMWLYPVPAVLAMAGWFFVFLSPAAKPGGWKFIVYALGTVSAGVLTYLIAAWKKSYWPFVQAAELCPAPKA